MVKINLLPPDVKMLRRLQKLRLISVMIAVVMAIAMVTEYCSLKWELADYQQESQKVAGELKLLQPEKTEQQQHAETDKQNQQLAKRLLEFSNQRHSMNALLVQLSSLITDKVVLTELKTEQDGMVVISGAAENRLALLKFVKNCSAGKDFFESVDLVKTAKPQTKELKNDYSVQFVLKAVIKNGDDKQDDKQ